MNTRIYWKIRKFILNIIFMCKSFVFKLLNRLESSKADNSLIIAITKQTLIGLIKGIVIAFILLAADHLVQKSASFSPLHSDILIPVLIGCIGVAGVILGLYCSNISSIYSLQYSNAPFSVSNAFRNDKLIRTCTIIIIEYIIFGLFVVAEVFADRQVSWCTVSVFLLWSIAVIISYSFAENRIYQMTDIYSVANDSHVTISRVIKKNLTSPFFSCDDNFQKHFQKVCDRQLGLLDDIELFGDISQKKSNASMVRFMGLNIAIVESYWDKKKLVCRDSLWFKKTNKYQKWHIASDSETRIALGTGTFLRSKEDQNYWWFENKVFSINRRCSNSLCEANDFSSFYLYLQYLESICECAIKNEEVSYFVGQLNYLRDVVERLVSSNKDTGNEENRELAGITELISVLYLDVVLSSSKYFSDFNIKGKISDTLQVLDSGKPLNLCETLRGKKQPDFYERIITEVAAEGKRITPDWVIAQKVAEEEYLYLNSIEDAVSESIDNIFNLGKSFNEKGFLYEACVLLTRFYEYESKLSRFLSIIEQREKELSEYHIDRSIVWAEPQIEKLKHTIREWKSLIPSLIYNCSSSFALKTWEMREEYPDFLGSSFYYICEDAVGAIINNNVTQFRTDYESLSKLMLLYQEYIRTDFLKENTYRAEFVYYAFTAPIVEWAQIGGLAILWGEFSTNEEWQQSVNNASESILNKSTQGVKLAEMLVKYIQDRNRFLIGIGKKDIIETGWQQGVENAIRESEFYQTEYVRFGVQLKTDSKLLKAFFVDFEYGFLSDPAEVFWVLCVNPLLPDAKRFHTKFSWEDKMNA